MRLKLFSYIPYLWAGAFATALAVVQLLEHTEPSFVLGTFAFILVSTTAFNVADGLTTLPGAYVFFVALLTGIVGIVVKAFIGEPGGSNLLAPAETMGVYVLFMVGVLLAVTAERFLRPRTALLPRYLGVPDLGAAFAGSALVGILGAIQSILLPPPPPGSLGSLFVHLDFFLPFAIILGTIFVVQRSGGKYSLSILLFLLLLFGTFQGWLGYTKQGMFSPWIAWLIGLVAARYRLKWRDTLLIAMLLLVAVRYAVPWSQAGRNYLVPGAAPITGLPVAVGLAQNFGVLRAAYEGDLAQEPEDEALWKFYSGEVGQLGRLTAIAQDDALIALTDKKGNYGYQPMIDALESLVPHFLWKNKPDAGYGNLYGRELGWNPDDTITGLSFGPASDAYHEGGLVGVLVVAPVALLCVFLLYSFVLGRTTEHPANLVLMLFISHAGPEFGLGGFVSTSEFVASIVFIALASRFVFPLLSSVLPSGRRKQKGRGLGVGSVLPKRRAAASS